MYLSVSRYSQVMSTGTVKSRSDSMNNLFYIVDCSQY